ncbi:hypothetical protein GQ600_7755 [Phytophthora cactorum]|nr:hypothetical protein GQ600_7755 [Phytophthora cactorum]
MRFQYLREICAQPEKKEAHETSHTSYNTGELDDDDGVNLPVPAEAAGGERRNQLLGYMLEIRTEREKCVNITLRDAFVQQFVAFS